MRRLLLAAVACLVATALPAATTDSLIPGRAPRGARAIIIGTGLDTADVAVTVAAAAGRTNTEVVLRSPDVLEFVIPATAVSGDVEVRRGAQLIGTFVLTIVQEPAITSVTTIATGFRAPAGITGDAAGNLYVADTSQHEIKFIAATGAVQTLAGIGSPGWVDGTLPAVRFSGPEAVALDAVHGILYVADTRNHVIRVIDLNARVVRTLAGSGKPGFNDGQGVAAQFKAPGGLAVDAAGTLYVADTGNHAIRRVTPAGAVTTLAGSGNPGLVDGAASLFHEPRGIDVAADGSIYVADSRNHVVRILAGTVTTVAGAGAPGLADGAGSAARFHTPGGLTINEAGALLVADTQNHAIRRIDGSVLTIAGMGAPGLADGTPLQARFHSPMGIHANGAVYVSDTTNGAVRALNAAPQLTDLYPRTANSDGTTVVRIFGQAFVPGRTSVTIDGVAVPVTFVSSTELLVTAPAHPIGIATLALTTPGGTAMLSDALRYTPPFTELRITPSTVAIEPGATQAFVAEGILSSGQATDITSRVTWSVSDATVASIDAQGVLTAHKEGNVTVTGTAASLSAVATVAVRWAFVALRITPDTIALEPGAIHPLAVYGVPGGQLIDVAALVTWASANTSITTVSTAGVVTALAEGNAQITATLGSLSASVPVAVEWRLVALQVAPAEVGLEPGGTQPLTATGARGNGATIDVTSRVTWSTSNTVVVTVDVAGLVSARNAGIASVTASYQGLAASASITVASLPPVPPDPSTVAPPIDDTVATLPGDAAEFLYSGTDPIQTGVLAGTIEKLRSAVLRGRVRASTGQPLRGVTVRILGRPQYGQTLSRVDGMYDLAINGGDTLTIVYERRGYITAQRTVSTQWLEFTLVDDVVLVSYDPTSTMVTLGAAAMQVVQGSTASDASGMRKAVVLIPAGTTASIELPNGTLQPATALTIRATELTVGALGDAAMPAELPPSSGYTYCVELSADEAVAAEATAVRFSRGLPVYVENFIGFPVGGIVPAGYYDRVAAAWKPANNGRVVKIMSIAGDVANLDVTGDNSADSDTALASIGIDTAERQKLATLYTAGQTLWRVSIAHFTPWDFNWPYGPPNGSLPPGMEDLFGNDGSDQPGTTDSPQNCPTTCDGSIIETETETLGERAPVIGTPFSLVYKSDRVPGRTSSREMRISLSGSTVPAGVQEIELELEVAGQQIKKSFAPAANLKETFVWNGLDAYGRPVHGGTVANVRVGYTYTATYQQPATFAQSFAQYSGVPMTGMRARGEITMWQGASARISGPWTNTSDGLGGWSLSHHHAYDPATRTVYFGDGRRRGVGDEWVMKRVAGTGASGFSGDGGDATQAQVRFASYVAVGPDNTVYISDFGTHRIRAVRNGIITTIAGTGSCCGVEDGALATEAQTAPEQMAINPSGELVFVNNFQNLNSRIFRIDHAGRVWKIAGRGNAGYSGDGGPALLANIAAVDIAFGRDGTMYIADLYGLRAVDRAGIIRTIGKVSGEFPPEVIQDSPVSQAFLKANTVAVGHDGAVYLSRGRTIVRLDGDGMVRVIAGGERQRPGNSCPSSDEGLTAPCANLQNVIDLAVAPDGTVYFSDGTLNRVGKISPAGIVNTVVGEVGATTPQTDGDPAKSGAADQWAIALGRDGAIYLGAHFRPIIWKAVPLTPWFENASAVSIAAEDGSEIYEFDNRGRHLRTRGAMDGAVLVSCSYDANGRLSTLTDADGRTTRIERQGASPAAIVGPAGRRTTFTLDPGGYLATINNPAGEMRTYSYSPDGLLLTYKNPRGGLHEFGYDDQGRLRTDKNPGGGTNQLGAARTAKTVSSVLVSPEGRTQLAASATTSSGVQRSTRGPNGLTTLMTAGNNGTLTVSLPGVEISAVQMPDPRFGMQAPVVASLTMSTGGKTLSMTRTRTASLLNPKDFFSMTSLTDAVTVNGRTWTSVMNIQARTVTVTSPLGRITTRSFDSKGRMTGMSAPGLGVAAFNWDSLGRLRSVTNGSRGYTMTYDAGDNLLSIEEPSGRNVEFTYDDSRRPVTQKLPDGRMVTYQYDAHGNITSVTPPGRAAHTFTHTANDLAETYTAPPADGASSVTHYEYNADRQLTTITRPGASAVSLGYDTGGRLTSISGSGASVTQTWSPSGNLAGISGGDASVTYGYDGVLLTSVTWNGKVAGGVGFAYDSDFRVVSESVNGTAIPLVYDADSLLTGAGDLTLSRDASNGLLTGTVLGAVTDEYTYNDLGEMTSYAAKFGDTSLLTLAVGRDGSGRITSRSGSVAGVVTSAGFDYDDAGRLVRVTSGGVAVAEYDYDGNSNRTEHRWVGGSASATYDDQDRLLTYDGRTYTYRASGELESITVGDATTTFDYDAFGNLRRVAMPGRTIEYLVDGQNRRVGKKVDGVLVRGWLYGDQYRIVAELDGSNQVVSRFIYGSRATVPDYMIRDGVAYRILADHLGSPLLVVNASDGSTAQTIAYDEFGRVLSDSAPGFQSFGFAGGLYDRDTGFLRFGARDYDPAIGRWTAKDPILFAGADTNLYAYVLQDPINLVDPSGLLFNGAVNAGEAYGQAALNQYADILTDPDSAWYEQAGAAVGGAFAALWTPCTSDATFITLSTAAGAGAWARQPYWRYVGPRSGPNGQWLTRGWRPPYGTDYARAKDALQLPHSPTGVVRVRPRLFEPVAGPRTVSGNPGLGSGGGTEYYRGWWFPRN